MKHGLVREKNLMGAPLRPQADRRPRRDEGDPGEARRRFIEVSLAFSTLLSLVALAPPLVAAAGWVFDLPALRQGYPTWPAMQPNTALGLSLGAVAVLLVRSKLPPRVRLLAICTAATIILLLGAATLSEYVVGWDLGIDRLFIDWQPTPADPYPGRPSPQTSLNLAVLGASLLWQQLSRPPSAAAQIGALVIFTNAVVALTGYIFDVGALYRFPVNAALTGMSAPTALTFIALALALLCSRPREGMMSLATSDSTSGAIARRTALILIVGWPLVGALTMLGANAGWYDVSLQASLFSLILLGLLLWSIWQAAWHGDQVERSKRAAEQAADKARDEREVLATRLRNLVELGSDGIFVADTEGRFTSVNGAGCRMLGYAREEIVGKTILDLILPEDVPRFIQHKERLFRGNVEVGEWILRRKDGTRVPVEVSAKVLPDGQWQAFVRDITERKRIERELRLSEAKFSGIVSISADAIILIDQRRNIVMFNEGAEKIFGYSKTEAIGAPLDTLIPERLRVVHGKHVEQFAAGPDRSRSMVGRGQVFGLRKSGEEFPADAAISKLTIEGESVLAVSLRDVTEQKRVEGEQRFLADAGAELSSHLGYEDTLECTAKLAVRGVADLCLVDVITADGKLRRRTVESRDPSMERACEALRQAPFDPSYLAPSALAARRPVIERRLTPERLACLAAGEAAAEAWTAFDPKTMIALPLTAQGKVAAVVVLLSHHPVKDLRLVEEFANRAATALQNALLYRELRQAIKGREDTLAIVSHDLGNPLAGILMMAKQLRLTGPSERDKLDEYASGIEVCADQMMALIKDLLVFSKIQSGTFSVRKRVENVKDVLASAVASARSQAEGRRQTLTMEVPATLPDLACDKHRIVQALSNLLGNAVKFTPEGGAISVRARRQGEELVISVSDNGPGIPAEALPKIFDRYWQAEETKSMGAGLGLAIAKGIAEAHGGRIWAESRVGAGSSFHFAVPLNRAAKQGAPVGAASAAH